MSEHEPIRDPRSHPGADGPDDLGPALTARLEALAREASGRRVEMDGVQSALARRRALRRRRTAMVAAAASVAVLVGGGALATRTTTSTDAVRTEEPTTTSPPVASRCILPGERGVIGRVELTGDQMVHLLARADQQAPSPGIYDQPATLDGTSYEALRAVPELAITVDQLRQMGYDLDAGTGPVTTIPPSTTTTQVDPNGPTPFEVWAQVLRDAGLLTPEQEAEIAAGRGISLSEEQSRVMGEYWDSLAPDAGPVASTVPVGGEVGPPLCDDAPTAATSVPATATTSEPPVTTTSEASEPAVTSTTVEPTEVPSTSVAATLPLASNGRQVDETAVAEGQEVWAVYVDVFPGPRGEGDIHEAEDRWFAAVDRASKADYFAGIFPLHCDLGTSSSWAGPLATDEIALASAAYFETEAQARAASAAIPGEERVAQVRLSCVDENDPITGWAHR